MSRSSSRWMVVSVQSGCRFGVREDSIGPPLGDVSALDVMEFGCGAAQLATARRAMESPDVTVPLVGAPAERVPSRMPRSTSHSPRLSPAGEEFRQSWCNPYTR
jgi:hypothetical protein